MTQTIRIIRPSGREKNSSTLPNIADFESAGFKVLFDDIPHLEGPEWTSNSCEIRARELNNALTEEESDIIVCARGGYGASDLLPVLDWKSLRSARPKPVVGFSDISALHSALFSKLGWKSIHGPMPLTSYWGDEGREDLELLFACLNSCQSESYGKRVRPVFTLDLVDLKSGAREGQELAESRDAENMASSDNAAIEGWIFGGCFSVLTNLLQTPYFPRSLKGAILMLEDVGENPARLLRYLNQWIQSGALTDVKAIILGKLVDLEDQGHAQESTLHSEFCSRTQLPVFLSRQFGHQSPNHPFQVGAKGVIADNQLRWSAKPMI